MNKFVILVRMVSWKYRIFKELGKEKAWKMKIYANIKFMNMPWYVANDPLDVLI